ncbi:MAG TPA: 50S ribosomal protein L17 [Bacteroidia bacterium]|nr:50S ribosomal protein L17 [Bacteroidia bacterium]
MRHGDKINNLSRTASHRKALLANLATQLFVNKRIFTTLAKAKALRVYVEPLITRAKEDTTHNRRIVFSRLSNKEGVKALFDEVREKVLNRNGGYTRIIKIGNRKGDAAEMAMIELVDFNEIYTNNKSAKTGKKTRTRRGSKSKAKSAENKSAETNTNSENTNTSESTSNE